MINKIRALVLFDIFTPLISYCKNRITYNSIISTKEFYDGLVRYTNDINHLFFKSPDIEFYIESIMRRFEYQPSKSLHRRLSIILYANETTGKNTISGEEFAELSDILFGFCNISGKIITLVRPVSGTWKTLWFDSWADRQTVWMADDSMFIVHNGKLYKNKTDVDSNIQSIMDSWKSDNFQIMHTK
jgi:hypothetical protein